MATGKMGSTISSVFALIATIAGGTLGALAAALIYLVGWIVTSCPRLKAIRAATSSTICCPMGCPAQATERWSECPRCSGRQYGWIFGRCSACGHVAGATQCDECGHVIINESL